MLASIQQSLGSYYIYIKFIHLLAVMIWSWSTSVAYVWYLQGAWKEWLRNPRDPILKARRNWAFEQFDRGVVLEHIAFPIILLTGPLLLIISGWPLSTPWLAVKLTIILLVFLPMEIFDYWISHLSGNKNRLKRKNDAISYEHFIQMHWLFFRISTPLIVIFVPITIFLAVVKPDLW